MRGVGRRAYGVLLRLLVPRRVRTRHGPDMLRTFEARLDEAGSTFQRLGLWGHEIADLMRGAGQMRATGWRRAGGGRAWADDTTHALRSLRRSPSHTLLVVGTLALGLGAASAVYSAVRHTILHPLPYEGADRLVSLWRSAGNGGFLFTPTPEQVALWSTQEDVLEGVIGYGIDYMTLTGRGEPTGVSVLKVTQEYLGFLGLGPALGRSFTAQEVADAESRVAVLGHGLWKRRFGGDPGVLGTTVSLDGEPWTVVGVAPVDAPLPTGWSQDIGLWIPLPPSGNLAAAVGRMPPGVTLEALNARLTELDEREAEDGEAVQYRARATSVSEMLGRRMGDTLRTLAVAVGLLLLIGCLNVSALLINRADARRHDTAVRVALGVGRGRLVRQHLLESSLLGLTAGGLGLGLAYVVLQTARLARPDDLAPLDRVALDPSVLLFALGISLGAGLLFGLGPALHVGRGRVRAALGGGVSRAHEGRGVQRARWMLVASEVALSFALLVGAGLLLRTVAGLQRSDPGFQAEGLVVTRVALPEWRYGEEGLPPSPFWDDLVARVTALPGVRGVALTSGIPTRSGAYFGTLEVEGRELASDEARAPFFGSAVDADYFRTLGQRMAAGRGFTPDEVRDEAPVYVLGESTARALWPDGDAVGRRMRLGEGEWHTVVGVAHDVAATELGGTDDRQIYTPLGAPGVQSWLAVRVAGDPAAVMAGLRSLVRQAEPEALVEVGRADDYLRATVATQRFTLQLLAVLAGLAALLASVGLYGAVAQNVGRRTREIGIRISLGARAGEILWMVLRGGAVAVATGIVAGALLSLAGARVIGSQLYGVEAGDPLTLLGAAALLGATALLATLIPARRAARVDPVKAIASE